MVPTNEAAVDAPASAWTLHLPNGFSHLCLGPLRPGMTRDEVAAFDRFYGRVERVDDDGRRAAVLATGFEGLEGFGLLPEDIASAREAYQAFTGMVRDTVVEHRGLRAPVLGYTGGRLSSVATDHHCTQLTFAGLLVYAGDAMALLAALEDVEAGEVLREGDTVWFPRLGVTSMGFYDDRCDGIVGTLGDLRGRHLVLEPFAPVGDAPPPVPVTFRQGSRGPA